LHTGATTLNNREKPFQLIYTTPLITRLHNFSINSLSFFSTTQMKSAVSYYQAPRGQRKLELGHVLLYVDSLVAGSGSHRGDKA
jgi:hypothetical protein